jgi:hypothetical protein
MAVRILLTSGGRRTIDEADSAHLEHPFFLVTRRDPLTGRVETVLTLRSSDVIGAEILENGVKKDFVPGGGHSPE